MHQGSSSLHELTEYTRLVVQMLTRYRRFTCSDFQLVDVIGEKYATGT